MKQAAEGLKVVAPSIDVLATSPLTRAAQTAEIVGNAYGEMELVRVRALEPGAGPEAVLRWLRRQRARDTVAIVGHEPDLSVLVSALLAETPDSFVDLKKGSACLVEFNGRANLGTGLLRWLLAPKQLRRIGAGGA